MWFHPRATIRKVVERDPTEDVDRIAVLIGITQLLGQNNMVDGSFQSTLVLLAFAALLGPVLGLIGIRINGAISGFIGRRLGGEATNEEVRAAYAWSALPGIAILPLQILFLLVPPLFSVTNPIIEFFFVVIIGITVVLWLWEVLLTVLALAEVNRYACLPLCADSRCVFGVFPSPCTCITILSIEVQSTIYRLS